MGTKKKFACATSGMIAVTCVFILMTSIYIVSTAYFMSAVSEYADRLERDRVLVVADSKTPHDLTVKTKTTGNLASHRLYFKVNVFVDNAEGNSSLPILYDTEGANADRAATTGDVRAFYAQGEVHSQPSSIEIGEDGSGSAVIYLKNDQSVVIKGIPASASYTVAQDPLSYTPSATTAIGTVEGEGKAVTVEKTYADNTIIFENERNTILNLRTFIILVVMAAVITGAISIKTGKPENT